MGGQYGGEATFVEITCPFEVPVDYITGVKVAETLSEVE